MVHFIGAGPGAPDLITVRGAKLLSEAGTIIYAGSLVNPELLKNAGPDCKIYNSAGMTLSEVIERMKESESRGVDTVRLHTGDPSIYGAIREQMDLLERLHIPYDVTPGVSAFCGAAASLRAEYTLPGVSQTVIITRMAGRTPVPERESIRELASHGATMAIYLSASLLQELKRELISGGYSPETPAAIVYKASWPDEKKILGTVGELPTMAESHGICRTALILIGEFLGNEYQYSKLYDPEFTHGFRTGKTL